jgi:protein phosphatase
MCKIHTVHNSHRSVHQFQFGAGTHTGYVRHHNEDSFRVDLHAGLWLIADGMGGRRAGDVASQVVAQAVGASVQQGLSLAEAVIRSHHAIQDVVEQGTGVRGMGSTVVVLKMEDNAYEIAWVGDSRAYLWGDGRLRQLTRDHTIVQHLLDAGVINRQEARIHPARNQLTRALGPPETPQIEVATVSGTLRSGEQVLLCSDGLTTELSEGQIAAILNERQSPQYTVERLIQAALDAGGRDNITVLLVPAIGEAPITELESDTQPVSTINLTENTDPMPILQGDLPPSQPTSTWTTILLIMVVSLITFLGLRLFYG